MTAAVLLQAGPLRVLRQAVLLRGTGYTFEELALGHGRSVEGLHEGHALHHPPEDHALLVQLRHLLSRFAFSVSAFSARRLAFWRVSVLALSVERFGV